MFHLVPWSRRTTRPARVGFPAQFTRDFDSLVDHFFNDDTYGWPVSADKAFTPAVDVAVEDDKVIVKAELPGMDAKDMDVQLENNILTIKGEKRHEKKEDNDGYYRVERSFGSFTRSLALPYDVQEDKVDANYKDGVLTLSLPRTEGAKNTTIKITATDESGEETDSDE